MPRLDNGDERNILIAMEWNDAWQGVLFDPEDPGATPPLDVCWYCWREFMRHDEGKTEHPPYDELEAYWCALCGELLTADDDEPSTMKGE